MINRITIGEQKQRVVDSKILQGDLVHFPISLNYLEMLLNAITSRRVFQYLLTKRISNLDSKRLKTMYRILNLSTATW